MLILALTSIPSLHYFSHWSVCLEGIALGVAGYIPVLAYTHGSKESPLGIMAPIAGTSPLITVSLSVLFLSVLLKPLQWVAIVLIVLANIYISVDFKNWRESNFLKRSTGVPFALIAALGWGLFYFFLVPVTRKVGPWLAAFLVETGVTIAAGLHLRYSSQSVDLKDILAKDVVRNGFLICLGTLAFTVGVKYYNVGIVAALSNSTALVASVLGFIMFKEHLRKKERVAAGLIILSVFALSLA